MVRGGSSHVHCDPTVHAVQCTESAQGRRLLGVWLAFAHDRGEPPSAACCLARTTASAQSSVGSQRPAAGPGVWRAATAGQRAFSTRRRIRPSAVAGTTSENGPAAHSAGRVWPAARASAESAGRQGQTGFVTQSPAQSPALHTWPLGQSQSTWQGICGAGGASQYPSTQLWPVGHSHEATQAVLHAPSTHDPPLGQSQSAWQAPPPDEPPAPLPPLPPDPEGSGSGAPGHS